MMLLGIFWLIFLTISCSFSAAYVNATCNPFSKLRTAQDPNDTHSYFICTEQGFYERRACPTVNGIRKVFVPAAQECLFLSNDDDRMRKVHRLPLSGSQIVGSTCHFDSDCLAGAHCVNGACACWSNHVSIGGFCWRKINPEEPGCAYHQQCTAVWPNTQCINSVCKCPFNRPPAYTKDGTVCYLPGECPINGPHTKLVRDDNRNFVSCSASPSGIASGCGGSSEIYDCIDSTDGRDGYCCPTRAVACVQPVDAGTGSPRSAPSQRFYYSSVTRSCQSFTYIGSGGNANNFQTVEQCESYCMQGCTRGQPQYLPKTRDVFASTAQTCTMGSYTSGPGCGRNYQCEKVGPGHFCCPEPSFICSLSGGLTDVSVVGNKPYNEGFGSFTGTPGPSIRYYWDADKRQCLTFRYLGQGGNFNNFGTQAECEAFCAKSLCRHGGPLPYSGSTTNLACSDSAGCPSTHECSNGVCCPTAQTVCNQPRVAGAGCNSFSMRYWYNATAKACEEFQYSGCQGNANNFVTLSECQNFCFGAAKEPQCPHGPASRDSNGTFYQCSMNESRSYGRFRSGQVCPPNYQCYFDGRVSGCCPTEPYTCSQPVDPGRSCGSSISLRWYYDAVSHTCRSFQYLGCDGNSNNFVAEKDCRSYCTVGECPDGGEPYAEPNGQARICSNSSDCPMTHACIPANSTSSLFIQSSWCCPKKVTICSLPREIGSNCGSKSIRYGYNLQTRTCEAFVYGGCNGNANNFPTMQACTTFCGSAACAPGETVLVDPNTNRVLLCGNGNSCPTGYSCIWDSLQSQSVCCGASDQGVCPSGQKVFVDSTTGGNRKCSPSAPDSCPAGFLCVYSPSRNWYYCCGSQPSALCPNDGHSFTDPATGQPKPCALNAADACPSGFTCQASTTRALYGYCCSGSEFGASGCPAGSEPYLRNGLPQTCGPGPSDSCPSGSTCHLRAAASQGICCSSELAVPSTWLCPNGTLPYISATTGRRQSCNAEIRFACPPNYQCHRQGDESFCCPTPAVAAMTCPTGVPGFVSPLTGRIQTCGSLNPCPEGYECLTSMGQALCCESGSSSDCPSGTFAWTMNGRTPSCAETTDCPVGYECTQRKCCPSAGGACSSPLQTGIPCETSGPSIRYFFNRTAGECTSFAYAGCGGNGNNFRSLSACQTYCASGSEVKGDKACPNGGRSLFSNGVVRACSVGAPKSCPPNHYCEPDAEQSVSGYCCPVTPRSLIAATCPRKSQAYVNPDTGLPQQCTVGDPVCPVGFICSKAARSNVGYCCSDDEDVLDDCPSGTSPLLIAGTTTPQPCRFSGFTACPTGSRCVYSSAHLQYICCSASSLTPSVDECGKVFPYPGTSKPLRCNRDRQTMESSCPLGSRCAFSSAHGYDLCCVDPTAADTPQSVADSLSRRPQVPLRPVACAIGTVLSSDGFTCLPELNPGDYGCIEDVQCIMNGHCDRETRRCHCDRRMVLFDSRCVLECPPAHSTVNGFCIPYDQNTG